MGLLRLGLLALVPLSALVNVACPAPASNRAHTISKRDTAEASSVRRSFYKFEDDEYGETEEGREDESVAHWRDDQSMNRSDWNESDLSRSSDVEVNFSKISAHSDSESASDSESDSGSDSDSDWASDSDSESESESGSESEADDDHGNDYHGYDYNNDRNHKGWEGNDGNEESLKPSWIPQSNGHHFVLHRGIGTVYSADGAPGSCGIIHGDDAFIVALGNDYMNYDYKSSHCGRRVQVRNTGANYRVGGKGNVIEVVVADTCASCHGNHIDFSHAAWDELTDESDHGQINLEWAFLD